MYDSTSTFKTRRKHHILLLGCLLATLINNAASMTLPVSCPEPCECYLNNNGYQSARCTEIFTNQTAFPNIHVLVMQMPEHQNECNIPKNVHLILPNLYFVYMMNCSLVHIPVETFKGLRSMQEIDLSNNQLIKLDASLFVNNPKLQYANLQNNPFRVLDRPFLISKSLRELDLTSCGIPEIPDNMFKNLTKLQYLTMNYNKLTIIEEDTLPSGLKVLMLNNNLINRIPIVELDRLKKMRKVDLSQNPINCTCDEMNFVSVYSGRPVIFENDVQCAYPRQYRGQSINKVPEQICYDQIGEGVDLPEDDPGDDNDDDYSDPQTNQIIPEEKPAKKKDEVQEDFERDQVVPFDKKSNPDYNKDEMQSDSISNEGSGDGDTTEIPEVDTTSKDNDETKPPSKNASDNTENNETKPDDTPPEVKPEHTSPEEPVTEKKSEVRSYEQELPNANLKTEAKQDESSTAPAVVPETKLDTDLAKPTSEATNSEPTAEAGKTEPANTGSASEASKSESPKPESASESGTQEPPKPDPETPVSKPEDTSTQSNVPETHEPETPSTPETPLPATSEKPSDSDATVGTNKSTNDNATSPEGSVTSHAHLQTEDSNSESPMFNFGYIIPCLAIIIVIIICLGVYLGQRSSHKNWEPNNTNTNNDGAELQDVSLLPSDRSKMPIVKNKKYPSEENSEQTERLMSDGDPSTPKSIWEHLEEPIENGNHKPATDTQLPNGQSIDKNEPIECAIAKVTTLPDSIPRTPLIRNT